MAKKAPLKILFDRNMLLGEKLFPKLGRAKAVDGRTLTAAEAAACDLLFIRSTCRPDAAWFAKKGPRFIGSGVVGTDHLDLPALQAAGIRVATAPGCNAESVADYVMASLLVIGRRQNRSWEGATLGIVGVGHVGSIVKRFAEEALGMRTLCCDPPRKDNGDWQARDFVDLETVLRESDVITFHTPLNEDGPYKTRGLYAGAQARITKPGAVLLNFARGPVCDNALLATMLEMGLLSDAAIDCWEGEPDYLADLAAKAVLASPHIAGHAYEGKANGTVAVYRAACEFLDVAPELDDLRFPPPPVEVIRLDCRGKSDDALLYEVVSVACDVEGDTARFRAAYDSDETARRQNFDALRKNYPHRRLFSATMVELLHPSDTIERKLRALGFQIRPVTAKTSGKSAAKRPASGKSAAGRTARKLPASKKA